MFTKKGVDLKAASFTALGECMSVNRRVCRTGRWVDAYSEKDYMEKVRRRHEEKNTAADHSRSCVACKL